ncbi:MAG: ABC transporter substrate-binding protein [Alphaproteobacteria bacterium]
MATASTASIGRCLLLSLGVLGLVSAAARAEDLTIGARVEPVMDPHFAWSASNLQFYRHYFGFVMDIDPQNQAKPGLAESFRAVSDTQWEFKLHAGLRFDNGKPLTAADVVASFERARTLPNAIGSYAGLFSGVTEIKAADDRTVVIVTSRPYPTLPNALTQIAILPQDLAKTASQADFIAGRANVASGPFRFVQFAPGDRLVLARNENYHGPKPHWDRVTFRFITEGSARVAALLAKSVDMIDGVPPQDVARVKAEKSLRVHIGSSDRGIFFSVDMDREPTPFVTDKNGAKLAKNPLKDIRVRRAMSAAIDRDAIRDRVMDGFSFPTGQIVARGSGGYAEKLGVPKYDPEGARALMREAGYPDGFGLAVQCPNDRYVNDARICQAVGQMLGRIGIKVDVQTMPRAVYFPRMTDRAGERGSFFMASWSSASSGEADVLQNAVHTYDKAARLGTWNLANYSNPEVDKLIEKALVTIDPQARHALQADAMTKAMLDVGYVPIHDMSVIVATRADLDYTTYADESTMATAARPAKK